MPNIPIHEEVAIKAINNYQIDKKMFLLGALAPDSVNYKGFAKKEDRWFSHQRKKNLEKWRKRVKEFYTEEKGKINDSFLLGYIFHIITDIVYDDYYYLEVKDNIISQGNEEEDAHYIMRLDMDYYGSKSEYYKKVCSILEDVTEFPEILNITEDILKIWLEQNLHLEVQNKEPRYITEELVNEMTKKVTEEMKDYL